MDGKGGFVEGDALAALNELSEGTALRQLLRRADMETVVTCHEPYGVSHLKCQFQVVGGEEDGLLCLATDTAQQQ